ncbi:MAG: DUF4363 family protein [Clostridiales bacterium]|nr:DUF4363 family protein [Clostridiales bacterium]
MKKTLIISLVGLIVVVILSIFIQKYLEKSSEILVEKIDELMEAVEDDKINESVGIREKIQEKWDDTQNKWAALIDHEEIDNIEETMHRIEMLIGDPEEKVELLSELNRLSFYLKHIPEREAFSIENIL